MNLLSEKCLEGSRFIFKSYAFYIVLINSCFNVTLPLFSLKKITLSLVLVAHACKTLPTQETEIRRITV
jgi:hypothetical protein